VSFSRAAGGLRPAQKLLDEMAHTGAHFARFDTSIYPGRQNNMVAVRVIGAVGLFCVAVAAHAEGLRFQDGRWKLEIAGYHTVSASDGTHRNENYGTVTLEYEAPMFQRMTLALRATPLFLYDEGGSAGTIYGAGGGLAFRYYLNGQTRSGLFGEVGSMLLWHNKEFTNSDGHLDFASMAGIGYRWEAGVQVSLRYEHISNGGLFKDNVNINASGVAVAYTF
jgi:hypothetical protein